MGRVAFAISRSSVVDDSITSGPSKSISAMAAKTSVCGTWPVPQMPRSILSLLGGVDEVGLGVSADSGHKPEQAEALFVVVAN
jgi:hypothetical protein